MQLLLWTNELSLGLPALISWQIKNISLQLLWCCPLVGGGEDTGGTRGSVLGGLGGSQGQRSWHSDPRIPKMACDTWVSPRSYGRRRSWCVRLGDQGDHVDGGLPAAADLFIYGLELDDVSNSLSTCATCTLTGPTLRAPV